MLFINTLVPTIHENKILFSRLNVIISIHQLIVSRRIFIKVFLFAFKFLFEISLNNSLLNRKLGKKIIKILIKVNLFQIFCWFRLVGTFNLVNHSCKYAAHCGRFTLHFTDYSIIMDEIPIFVLIIN
jgi:hypothetical protein